MEEKTMAQISKSCPNCGSAISFDERAMHATCSSCDTSFKVSELMNPGASAADNAVADMAAMFASFESPESGLVYLESVFANVDWDLYAKQPTVIIDKVQQMIEKNNIKAGAVATTWYLDFLSLATPLAKKFEGLDKVATEMGEKFNPKDNTTILGDFDNYKAIVKHLILNKEKFIRRLDSDVAFATKLGLDAEKLAEMQEKAAKIKGYYANIPEEAEKVDDIEFRAIPGVAAALAKADEKLEAEYSKKGIDAKSAYKDAVQYFNSTNPNKNGALQIFESIIDYKDSADYVEKINKYFDFNGEYFNFLGKSFVFKMAQPEEKEGEEGVNPKAKDKKSAKKGCGGKKKAAEEEEEYQGPTLELYEVVDKLPSEKPVIEKITKILTVYANKLFYIKNGKTIAAYDFGALNETEICTSKHNDIKLDSRFYNSTRSKMYLVKDMKEAKVGCFAKIINKIKSIFKKKQKAPKVKNTIALMEINLANNTSLDIIDAAMSIKGIHDDYIFYSVAEDFDEEDLFNKIALRSYNTHNGDKKVVLEDTHEIHEVINGKVVYTVNTPNVWNMQLRVHDIESQTDVVIEDNIYDYKGVHGDRIFYVVGNAAYLPLYSNSFEGNDRVEVMTDVEDILDVINNWIYIQKFSPYYDTNVIYKVSLDGKEKIALCANYKSTVKITDTFFYYIDKQNNLCVVQGNGNGYCKIAEGINKNDIIIDNKRNKIYYLRYETVGYNKKNYSLYAMDIEGHGVKKVIFDVTAMKDYDKDTLYIKRNERCAFVLKKPGEIKKKKKKGESEGPEITVLDLVRFYKFDKATCETELMLTIGMPDAKYQVKAGCGKTSDEKTQFIQLPRVPDYIENPVSLDDDDEAAEPTSAAKKAKEQEATAAKGGCDTSKLGCGNAKKATDNASNGCKGCSGKK